MLRLMRMLLEAPSTAMPASVAFSPLLVTAKPVIWTLVAPSTVIVEPVASPSMTVVSAPAPIRRTPLGRESCSW